MTTADEFDAPTGSTLYGRAFEAITEAFDGNGFPNSGSGEITPGSSDMTVNVAAGSVRYDGTVYNLDSTTLTVPSSPTSTTNGQEDNRVDIVVFDATSESYTLIEGAVEPNPIPPLVPNDALLVGFVEVQNGVSDITSNDVLNWRAVPAASFPVNSSELADGSVTTSKIGDEQVTEAKIDPDVDLGGGGANLSVTDDGVIIESTTETLNAGAGVSAVADGTGKVTLLLEQNADGSYAQMLSRRHNDLRAYEIQHATGISARKSQVLARRNTN